MAPSVCGQQGTAVLPSLQWANDSSPPTLTFKSWSKISNNSAQQVLSCYSDDGRIAVNSELCAASNIYAAGSVAKYANHLTGHATVAGEGIVDGSLAGVIAAENMVTEYHKRMNNNSNSNEYEEDEVNLKTHTLCQDETLPVLRTDRISTSGEETSSLSSLGVHALFVGQCDSENMSTHGFWWTNQSLQNKRLSRRMTRTGAGTSKYQKAVYGSGVVFYLDRSGSIRGIMLWGMPFTTASNDKKGQNDLNEKLLHRMKSIILSDGKIMKDDYKAIIQKMNLDPCLLSQSHLAEESKNLATLAVDSSSKKQDFSNISTSRPLHRFLPSKSMFVTSMGILRRNKAIGNGSAGDDVYERSRHQEHPDSKSRHPSLVHYFSYDWSFTKPTPIDDDSNNRELGEDLDMVSRPPKEDPLWFRRNESGRTMSMNEKMSDIFTQNIKRGQFFDGNDAVKQAPTPAFVLNSMEEIERWIKSEDGRDN